MELSGVGAEGGPSVLQMMVGGPCWDRENPDRRAVLAV